MRFEKYAYEAQIKMKEMTNIPLFFYRLDGKMDEIANALDERNGGK